MIEASIQQANTEKAVVPPFKIEPLHCNSCNVKLADIYVTKNTTYRVLGGKSIEITWKYQVGCPCGGESFIYSSDKDCVIVVDGRYRIVDAKVNPNNQHHIKYILI